MALSWRVRPTLAEHMKYTLHFDQLQHELAFVQSKLSLASRPYCMSTDLSPKEITRSRRPSKAFKLRGTSVMGTCLGHCRKGTVVSVCVLLLAFRNKEMHLSFQLFAKWLQQTRQGRKPHQTTYHRTTHCVLYLYLYITRPNHAMAYYHP